MAVVHLKAGHVQPLWAGHPWVFAQAIERVEGAPGPGDVVSVTDPRGKVLGRGFWSPRSAIPVRVLTRGEDEVVDEALLGRRLEAARLLRHEWMGLPDADTTGYRLVHGEGDGLPGLIVDVYDHVAAVQILTIGMKRREDALFAHVARVTGAGTVLEIPNERVQRMEGFEAGARVARGPDVTTLRFRERGFDYEIPLEMAQKTGFYFDQRDNRARLETLVRGRRVLDAYSYVGPFALAAARGGAERVVAVDSAAHVVAEAATISRHHGFGSVIEHVRADLKRELSARSQRNEKFDVVVVDPPRLAPTSKHLAAGQKAYRRLNAEAMKLVERGGMLVSCSCSAAMTPERFLRTLAMAARDAARETSLLWLGGQGPDHPVPTAFPEGRYLEAAFLQVR
ncbi:MAG: class I SAM-dependent rRNA methyltransferase [Myxococcota bacterium]